MKKSTKLPATPLRNSSSLALAAGGIVVALAITSLNAATIINPLGSAFKSTDNGLHEVT